MINKIGRVIITLTIVSITIANGISGVAFLRHAVTMDDGDEHGFFIDRAYLTFNKKVSDKAAFIFQGDVQNKGEAYYMFLKKAMMTYKVASNTKVVLGLQGMNMFNVQENTWGNRFIAKSALDMNGWSSSADLGIGISQRFKNVSASVLYTNGEGYKKVSSDNKEKLSIQLVYGQKRLDRDDGFNLGGVFSSLGSLGSDQPMVMGVFGGWAGHGARAGFEYDMGSNMNLNGYSDSSSLMSFYGNYHLPFVKGLTLLARYDMTDTGVIENDIVTIIAGIRYRIAKGIVIAPNFMQETIGSEDPSSALNISCQMRF